MESQFDPDRVIKDLGKTWMLTNGTLLANLDSTTSRSIVKEVEFAYMYYEDVCKILGEDRNSGGIIIERHSSTLMMSSFVTEHDRLISAEGEWVGDNTSCFDYCLTRV